MLQPFPTLEQEMDFFNIDRKCWQCANFKQWNSAADRCESKNLKQSIMDLTGVQFTNAFILPVEHDTDASLCCEFELSEKQTVVEEILEMVQDAAIESRRHVEHYNYLRRTVA